MTALWLHAIHSCVCCKASLSKYGKGFASRVNDFISLPMGVWLTGVAVFRSIYCGDFAMVIALCVFTSSLRLVH